MTFTYDPTLSDDISKVRDLVGDIEADYPEFQDETLQAYLDMSNGNVLDAAVQASFRLYVNYAKMADVSEVDNTRTENRNKSKAFENIYKELKVQSAKAKALNSGKPPIYFGGIDKARFNANREDSTLTPNDFTKDSIYFDRRFPELTEVGNTPPIYTDEY